MIDFMKMIAVRDFVINSIYMIFDIISLIHTNFTIVKNAEQKFFLQTKCRMDFRPAGRTQDDLFVLQGASCRTKFLTPCPASCKTGRLSNSALQDAGQDAKNRPATFSGGKKFNNNVFLNFLCNVKHLAQIQIVI